MDRKKGLELEHTSFPRLRSADSEIAKKLRELATYPNVVESLFDYTNHVYRIKIDNGEEYISANTKAWYKEGSLLRTIMPWQKGDDPVKAPKRATSNKNKPDEIAMDSVQASVMKGLMDDPYGDATPTQRKIREITEAMKDLLLYKNNKYGDSAINPKKVFYKGDATNSILIRLDDKLGRVMSNTEEKPRVNDVCDIIGYCTLLLISMGVTPEDIAKFKD